jgi:hypothetical protein
MISDVKKAYFYAPATRRVFVALPPEDRGPGEEQMCGLLLKSLYGTRDAAFNWSAAYTDVLVSKLGFVKGESSPCSFYHPGKQLSTVVHGDDFVTEGERVHLDWFNDQLKAHFELKTEILGPDSSKGEQREVRILNRVLRWEEKGICWEADPRHAELVVRQLGLETASTVTTPGSKEEHRHEVQLREEDAGESEIDELARHFGTGNGHVESWADCADSDEETLVARDRGAPTNFRASTSTLGGRVSGSGEDANHPADEAGPKPVEVSSLMAADGWERVASGADTEAVSTWRIIDKSAKAMIVPPVSMRRRVTRRINTMGRLEDLRVDASTSRRMLRRSLREPADI